MENRNEQRPKGPGLKWRPRRAGPPVPYWFADKKAIDAGYPVKSANLSTFADHPAKLIERAQRFPIGDVALAVRPGEIHHHQIRRHLQVVAEIIRARSRKQLSGAEDRGS